MDLARKTDKTKAVKTTYYFIMLRFQCRFVTVLFAARLMVTVHIATSKQIEMSVLLNTTQDNFFYGV